MPPKQLRSYLGANFSLFYDNTREGNVNHSLSKKTYGLLPAIAFDLTSPGILIFSVRRTMDSMVTIPHTKAYCLGS
jgi:hypothetical protein